MLVTFNIAFLYINILFRILKQKVVNIKSADIAGGTLEIRNSEIQNDQIDSDINDVANGCDTSGNEKSNQIREISRPPVRFGMDNSDFSKSDIQNTNEKGEFEQNQNSSSCVENPVNTVCSSNSSQQDNYQINASSTFNYYVTESEFETDRGIRFYPPVYIQRYNSVKDVLTCEKLTGKIKKVVEFGCAEMTFFSLFLKRIYEIEEIIEVDVDRDILNQYFHKVSPQTSDYIKMRTTPLKVQLYEGSVANTHSCLSGANAVICIELIEHLYPDDLDALPFTIFGYIRPQVAIFTTPNVDFNVLFPGLSGFRHPDHKFEWSRDQFQSWAKNLIVRYPDYQVSFEGIGNGPAGTEKYGCCSQMAVFNRNTTEAQTTPSLVDNTIQAGEYKLLREYDFPVYVDLRTEEQKICDNAVYYINRCRSMDKHELSSSSGIPLTAVLANVNCHSLAQLRDILEKNNWRIRKNEYDELVIPNSSPESEEFSDSDNDYDWESRASGLQDFNSDNVSNAQADIDEDWNEQYNPFDLSGNRSTGANMEIDSTLRLDSNNGFWTTENTREYSPVNSRHVSDEKINMCIVKEAELSVPVSNNMVPELMLLNEKSETECLISNIAPAIDLCKLHTETALGEDEIYCNLELMSNHSFDKSVYNKMSYKSGFFCSQNISYKSLSEEEETMCNTTLTDIEPTKDSSQEHYKESLDLHNNGKDNKICPCCNSVLQNYILPLNATEVAHKLLTAEELKKDTALSFKQNEEQIDCNDALESNESSEILMGLQDSCSACKAVDSGYPNTSSCQDMDMDLTPEQVDEILTENESSLNGAADNDDDGDGSGVGHNEIESDNDCNDCDDEDDRGGGGDGDHDINGGIHDENGDDGGIFEDILRPDSPVQFPMAPLGHNVENGDLVNNNQDNEGNNMIGQIDDEILEFEVQVNENGDLPVLAAVEGYGEDRVIDEINDICKND